VIELVVSAAVTAAVCPVVRRLLVHRGVVDHPNDRSSHVVPTPRGGGLACSVGVLAGWTVALASGRVLPLPVLAVILALAVLGLLDDHFRLSALIRLATQVVVGALLGVAVGGGLGILPGALLSAVLVSTSVNIVNFMDGINGITGITMAVWGSSVALLGYFDEAPTLLVLGSLTVGAALGFLPYNLPRARLFLGDVGSYLFGALVATTLLLGMLGGARLAPLFAPVALYFADASVTLVRRAIRRASLLKPHREHTYQRLVHEARLSHVKVSVLTALLSVAVTGSWFVMTPLWGSAVTASVVTAYLLLPTLLVKRLGRRSRRVSVTTPDAM